MQEERTPQVGQKIRVIREQRGLSLRQLAELSGLSANAISRIEHGENSPTVASLHALAGALRVSITEFFQEVTGQRTVLVRHGIRLRTVHAGIEMESLGIGLRNQQIEPFLLTLQAGSGRDSETITHAGQEFVFCITGTICYEIAQQQYVLEAGDSLLFEAAQPHRFWNPSNRDAQIMLVFQTQDGNLAAGQWHLDP